MAIDIVGYINTVWTATTERKSEMLDNFCTARGYNPESGITKKDFVNQDIINYIKIMDLAARKKAAIESIILEELNL